jgi:hypothetical protein
MRAGFELETLVIFRLPICDVKCGATRGLSEKKKKKKKKIAPARPDRLRPALTIVCPAVAAAGPGANRIFADVGTDPLPTLSRLTFGMRAS